jgi:hypothetical protein
MFAPPPSSAPTPPVASEAGLKPKGASSLDDLIREGRENKAAADAEVEANGGFFKTVFKREGFLGGTEPSPQTTSPAAPPKSNAKIGGGGAVACGKGEERCVDSRVSSGLLAPWRSSRGGANKGEAATVRDLRRACKAIGLRAVRERNTPAGPIVTAESPEGDLFEFLAGGSQVDFRVRAAKGGFPFGSDGGSVSRAKETLERMRNLLYRQFDWGSA